MQLESPDDEPIVQALTPMVKEFRSNPHAELELRLGSITPQRFVSNVPYAVSKDIFQAMTTEQSLKQWDAPKKHGLTYRYYAINEKKRPSPEEPFIRGVFAGDVGTYYKITRKGVLDVSYQKKDSRSDRFDLRFSLKLEEPCDHKDGECYKVRTHQRFTIIHDKAWQYDFTKSSMGDTTEEACARSPLYSVELELLHHEEFLKKFTDRDIAIKFLGRGRDLLGRYEVNTIGEVERVPISLCLA